MENLKKSTQHKNIGILTGGGDCPGLNAVIRAVVRTSLPKGYHVIGFLDGWAGLLEKRYINLDYETVSGILHVGGTILRTSRTNVLKDKATMDLAFQNFKELKLHGLIAVGGEGTLFVSKTLSDQGMNLVGCPKTIDNDINATDYTFGFDTAVEIATEAIDRIHTTAESHNRVMVVEVMGRHAGWIAAYAGVAGGADVILVPEFPMAVEKVCELVEKRRSRGKRFSIVVVAEGSKLIIDGKVEMIAKDRLDAFGRPQLGGVGQVLANEIEIRTGIESRVTVLGHVQRGGTPTARDRFLATRLGAKAAELAHEGKWGRMSAIQGTNVTDVSLSDATKKLKTVDEPLWTFVQSFVEG